MEIKKSGFVGRAVERLLHTEDRSGEELAVDLNISSQHLSNIKRDRRTMAADTAQDSIALSDNPEYTMDILYEFSSHFTSPVLRGKSMEQHRLAIEANAKREIEQALEMIQTICLAKPPGVLDENEREGVKRMMDDLIEARIHIDNLLKQLQVEYKISIMGQIKSLIPRWKAKGWLE